MASGDLDELDPVFRALADPTRRRLLDLMRERAHLTGELCAQFPLSRYAVMKHLDVLEAAGLLIVQREGRRRWNHLNAIPLQRIVDRWMAPFERHWAAGLVSLKKLVEGQETQRRKLDGRRSKRARGAKR